MMRKLRYGYNPCHNCAESHEKDSMWLLKTSCVGCSFYPLGKDGKKDGADDFQNCLIAAREETITEFKSNWKAYIIVRNVDTNKLNV